MNDRQLTCLVTGATSGLGEAIATGLASQGAHVFAVARNAKRGHTALARLQDRVPGGQIDMLAADLSVLSEVRTLAEQVKDRCPRLEVLILNAGVARPCRELTVDGLEVDFATNHLAPFLLTNLLSDLLLASAPARVVVVSSSGHRHIKTINFDALPTGTDFHHLRTYSTTKLLNILFTTELSHRLGGTGVTANAADPGFVRTALGRDAQGAFAVFLKIMRPFQLSPEKAAVTPKHLAISPEVAGISGAYFANCRATAPSTLAQDRAAAQRLWELSTQLI
jgi:retinol dehydrogenase 12